MKFLILGGAGFLGTNLTRAIVRENPEAQVTAVDSLDPEIGSTKEGLAGLKINFLQGDIRDQSLLDKVIPGVDVIFNCAAQTSHPRSLRDPILDADTNCLGNLRVLETMRLRNRDAIIVYPSSSTVIGKLQRDIIDESHPEHPLEVYSANKGVAEKYYEIYHSAHGLKTIVLRFANLYGPYGKKSSDFGFFNYFINLARTRQAIQIYGDGTQLRNIMHVDDATAVMMEAIKHPELFGQMYFATSPFHHPLREIAEGIVKHFQRGEARFIPWPEDRMKIEIGSVRFSSAALEKKIGWKAKISLAEGLNRTKAELERHTS